MKSSVRYNVLLKLRLGADTPSSDRGELQNVPGGGRKGPEASRLLRLACTAWDESQGKRRLTGCLT